jgi:hypothetical protein
MANRPTMDDPTDRDIHDPKGVAPYPATSRTENVTRPEDDELTSTPDNSFERGLVKDGEYRDAVDEMAKTLKDEGSREAWKKGRTQNETP